MHARLTRFRGDPAKFDEARSFISGTVVPGVKGQQGFVSGTWLGNAETGEVVGVALWESEEAIRASEAAFAAIRSAAEQETGGQIQSIEIFEVLAQA